LDFSFFADIFGFMDYMILMMRFEDFCLQGQKVVSPTACHYLHIETAFLAWFDDRWLVTILKNHLKKSIW